MAFDVIRDRKRRQAGRNAGRTYAEFVAHITGLATRGSVAWGNTNFDNGVGGYVVPYAAVEGTMAGSPWNTSFEYLNSAPGRVIRHGLPSQAAADAQVAASRTVFVRVATTTPDAPVSALARNGYTSLSNGANVIRGLCTEIIYWDGTQAQQMNPSTATGPTPYTF